MGPRRDDSIETTRIFNYENPNLCTLVIVPGSSSYHVQNSSQSNIITNIDYKVHYTLFTSELPRNSSLVQAPWAKQREILRSGS
jgi:hypothetical protein